MFTWTLINILPAGGSGTSQYFRKPWPSQKVQKHMIHRPWPERFPWSHPESSRILRAHGASCRWRSDSRLHARQTCWDGSMRFDWTLQVTVVAAVWFYDFYDFCPIFWPFIFCAFPRPWLRWLQVPGLALNLDTDSEWRDPHGSTTFQGVFWVMCINNHLYHYSRYRMV